MSHLTETQVNKYIDGETEISETGMIEEHAADCPACRKMIEGHKQVHGSLFSMKESAAPLGVTEKIMRQIERSLKRQKEQRYYTLGVAGLFSAMIFAIILYLISITTFSFSVSESIAGFMGDWRQKFDKAAFVTNKILEGQNLKIIGSILSMGIIISAYIFYNSKKNFRNLLK